MINVIKHGKETFKAVCPICGCEFTYQAEDLKEDCFHNHYVECPDCKQAVSHAYEDKKKSIEKGILWDYLEDHKLTYDELPDVILTNSPWPDCATCPNRPDPNKPAQVGDTPCTWCIKNRPYCASSTAYTAEKVETPDIKGDFTTNIK